MPQRVMNWLILVAFHFSHIHALSECSFCKTAPRGFKSSKVLDMDFLMDFHYPKVVEQPEESVAKAHPLSEQFDHLVRSFLSNPSTENPIVWEHRGLVNSEKKIRPPHAKDQTPIGKFIKNHAEEMKRDFLAMMTFRKTRQTNVKRGLAQSGRLRTYPHIRRSLGRKRHTLAKRFFVSRKLHHFPKSRRFKVDPFGNFSWTPWHTNGHLVNVTKRDTSNRRMKLSDILTRAGFKKDKEEAIKVVLPLLLSDLKDTPAKNTNPILATDVEQAQSHVISSSSGKQSQRVMRNFKVKGDDGKEFSFSASAADVQQLMEILAKPNSSVVLERVTLDKNRSLLKTQTNRTKPNGRKKTPSLHKAKDAVIPATVNNTEALQLKEIESCAFESILQLDVPSKQSKSTIPSPDATNDCETSTSGDTTGS